MKLKIFDENVAEINSYVLIKENNAIIIDPGFNGENIIAFCIKDNLSITDVILTHGHFDHIKSLPMIADKFNYVLHVSQEDSKLLANDENNYAKAFGATFKLPNSVAIRTLKHKDILILNDEKFEIIATPGHTRGSICIKYRNWLFSGDTLFVDSVGRTDLFSGSMADLRKSLNLLKTSIGNGVIVYPGHGEHAKMIKIKELNDYLK